MSGAVTRTPTVGLGDCIRQNCILVPSHQRDYSWAIANVKTFIEDIEKALDSNSEIYFCGLMVFTRSSPRFLKVLDGQQRLATTLMVFSAIRNWLRLYTAYKETEILIESQLLTAKFIGRPGAIEPKLSLTVPNNDFFKRYVIDAVPVSDIESAAKKISDRDRSKNLMSAIVFVNRHIGEIASRYPHTDATHTYFARLIEYLSNEVQIVELVLDNDASAYTIFETLNDRGLELAPLDLVKNYLFSKAASNASGGLSDLEGRWSEMMLLLGAARADSFLRAFWATRYRGLEGTKLFREFKKTYNNAEQSHAVSLDMRRDAERYSALFNPSDPYWSSFPTQVKRTIRSIAIIDPTQMYPIVLAGMEKFSKVELVKLLRLVEIVAVRYQLVYRGRPGRIESLGNVTARAIWNRDITTASEVKEHLSELYIPDDEFKRMFATKTEREPDKSRYLLMGIERQSLLRDSATFSDELDASDALTLEHIFPKSPKGSWSVVIQEDEAIPEMLHRLGNMCLLAGANRALGNRGWEEKLEVYKKSRLHITNHLTIDRYPIWNRASIEKRQRYMAEYAVAEWRWP